MAANITSHKVNRKTNSLGLSRHQMWCLGFFISGTLLRILLCWENPPENAFDDHFKPIQMIMESGAIPAKDACFQCYHPSVFYWVSAMIGNAVSHFGVTPQQLMKVLQFVNCFYGVATLGVCWLLFNKLPLSSLSKLLAFGTVCFLPRHIYMCAMNANDTMSYLFVALSIYCALIAFEGRLTPRILGILSIVLTITVFIKYTAFAIIPAIAAGFFSVWRQDRIVERKRVALSLLATLVLPILALAIYMIGNVKHYQTPLPWNVAQYDPSRHHARDEGGISFIAFKPWEEIHTPLLVPGQLHSFWTLIYGGMWFDTEPHFVPYLDSDQTWWKRYYAWFRGRGAFPGENPTQSALAAFSGRSLVTLGLVPLALMLLGGYFYVAGKFRSFLTLTPTLRATVAMFPALIACNVAGVIALTMRLPVYNSIKPSYLLGSTPAFMFFLSLGIMRCEENKILRTMILILFGILFGLVAVHIIHAAVGLHGVVVPGK